MVSKICCLSRLNSWLNLLDTVMKSHLVISIEVNSNKGIFPNFSRNVLDGFRDDHDELLLVYLAINLPPFQLQELPCLIPVLLCVEFIIVLIEIACPRLLITNPDPILRIFFEAFSDIDMRLEAIRCG